MPASSPSRCGRLATLTAPPVTCWPRTVDAQAGASALDEHLYFDVAVENAGNVDMNADLLNVALTGRPPGDMPDEYPMSPSTLSGTLPANVAQTRHVYGSVFFPSEIRDRPVIWTASISDPEDHNPGNDTMTVTFGPCPGAR